VAVVHAFRDIEPALGVEVDVGGIVKQRRGRPDGDLELVIGDREQVLGDQRLALLAAGVRLLREDLELRRGVAFLAFPDCAAVVDASRGAGIVRLMC
jgi:hypothetical protein